MTTGLSRVEIVFFSALKKTNEQDRAAYLDEKCADDQDLRARVQKLLDAQGKVDSFLEGEAANVVETHRVGAGERPGTVISHYKLLQQIGEGGFGVVYMAEQQEPVVRKVAVKVIKPGMDTKEIVARFEAERQALAMMDHPNIARVFDAGATESGRPYFVMELVRGLPITEFCDKNDYTPRERLRLFASVCHAVQHAHQKGVIHRDIKPRNVLVTLHDGQPVVKVIDFGIAKALHQRLTDKTLFTDFLQMVGTPLYMSPEQAELSGLDVDTRADVYSLGVLLYELLVGATPFDKERMQRAAYDEMRRIIREEEPMRPSNRLSTLGGTLTAVCNHRKTEPRMLSKMIQGDLDWIVMKSLEKDRSRRYDTASAFANDVRRFLGNETVEARPPSLAYRASKFVRRNRTTVAGATLLMLTLLLGIIGTTSGWIRASQSLNELRGELKQKAHTMAGLGPESEMKWAIERAQFAGASDDWANTVKGQYWLYKGDSERALAYLLPVCKRDPENIAALALLAEAYVLDGDWDSRVKVIDRLRHASRAPSTAEEKLLMAIADRYSGNSVPLAVVEDLPGWRTLPMARIVRSRTLIDQALRNSDIALAEKAELEATVARELLPDSAISFSNCLQVYIECYRLSTKLGESNLADECKASGLKLIAENADFGVTNGGFIHSEQARFYELIGDLDNASRCFRVLVREQSVGYQLGLAAQFFHRHGEFDLAMEIWKDLPRLNQLGNISIFLEFPDRRAEAIRFLKGELHETPKPDLFVATFIVSMMCMFDEEESAREASMLLNSISTEYRDIARFFANEIDYDQYWATVSDDDPSRAWAHFWTGFKKIGEGDRTGALLHWKSTEEIYGIPFGIRNIANTLAYLLENDRQWPLHPSPDHSSRASSKHERKKN